jgi:hypothetical protein
MKKKLDKKSKLPSGKNKETASQEKPKAKTKASSKPAPKSGKTSETASQKTKPEKTTEKAPARPSAAKASKKPSESRGAKSPRISSEDLGLEEFAISLIKPGEKKERIWRTKNFQQIPAQRDFGFPDTAPELPGQYSQDKLVLMPKDPEYMFCYWELTSSLLSQKEGEKLPDGNYRETLKINWESRSLFDPNFTFIPVFFWARKWYFGVPQVGQRYQVELGWLSDSGHFISIIRSNLSELPESWATTQKRLAGQGDVLAYSVKNTKVLGSSEHMAVEDARAFVPEWNLSSESLSSSSWSRGPSAPSEHAAKPSGKSPAKPATPKARLEVTGKVLPGTRVLIGGSKVSIDPQGFFKMEFPYNQDILNLELTSGTGASRSFTYDLKELVLT